MNRKSGHMCGLLLRRRKQIPRICKFRYRRGGSMRSAFPHRVGSSEDGRRFAPDRATRRTDEGSGATRPFWRRRGDERDRTRGFGGHQGTVGSVPRGTREPRDGA